MGDRARRRLLLDHREPCERLGSRLARRKRRRRHVVGVNNNTDFLRAISSGTVTAESTPIHRGRRQQLWLITITDDKDRVVARGQVRLQNMPPE